MSVSLQRNLAVLSLLASTEKTERTVGAQVVMASSQDPRKVLEEKTWSCLPASKKVKDSSTGFIATAGADGKEFLKDIKAFTDAELQGLVALHDTGTNLKAKQESVLSFKAAFNAENQLSWIGKADPFDGSGIAFTADGKEAILWKAPKDKLKFLPPAKDTLQTIAVATGLKAMERWTLEELEAMPTLSHGHTDDLKIDDGKHRVWLSRMTVRDGAPYDNQVTVEKLRGGRWETVDEYDPTEIRAAVANDFRAMLKDTSKLEFKEMTFGELKAAIDVLAKFKYKEPHVDMKDGDPYDDLEDKKRPAVVQSVEDDPAKKIYEAKMVSLADVKKNYGKWMLSLWCPSIEEAREKVKMLERRRADQQRPAHWPVPDPERDGEGIKKTKGVTGQDLLTVKEIKTNNSPNTMEKKDDKRVTTTEEDVQRLRRVDVKGSLRKAELNKMTRTELIILAGFKGEDTSLLSDMDLINHIWAGEAAIEPAPEHPAVPAGVGGS